MAGIADLSRCDYIPLPGINLLAIGWLSRGDDYPRGEVSQAFFEKLKELCRSPWEPVASAGLHSCDVCQFDGVRFYSNVYIPYQGNIYVAPVGIVHYIAVHWYKPPEIFIQAVMACPDMNSMEYKKAILANGGRELVKYISATK